MKKGAKRQVVICPSCQEFKVTLGEVYFRCCGELHKITEHRASLKEQMWKEQREGLEVSV